MLGVQKGKYGTLNLREFIRLQRVLLAKNPEFVFRERARL
jgi:hypothetical protein